MKQKFLKINFMNLNHYLSFNTSTIIRPKTPSIKTISSFNDSPTTLKTEKNVNNYNSPISPTSTLNINKKLPKTPPAPYCVCVGRDDINNLSEVNLNNVESNQQKSLLKRIKSLPFLKKPYSESMDKYINPILRKNIFINDKNEIVLPDNIKNLNNLRLNKDKFLLKNVEKNFNSLLNDGSPILDNVIKSKF